MPRLGPALLLGAMLTPAFSQTAGNTPAFEVASIKLHESDEQAQSFQKGGPGTSDPGRITATYRPLRTLLSDAYGIKTYQLELPDALNSARYDVTATVPAGATKEQARAMMRNLLAARLGLKIRTQTKVMQVYALVPAKGGPKLRPSTDAPAPLPAGQTDSDGFTIPTIDPVKGGIGAGYNGLNTKVFAVKQTVPQLVAQLQGQMDAPIVDLTGLTGRYDFTVRYAAQWRRAGSSGSRKAMSWRATV